MNGYKVRGDPRILLMVLNKECVRKRAKNFACHAHFLATPTNPSVLEIIIILSPIYSLLCVHTTNRQSAYRESLENHRYYLCHVSLQQLKLCYGLKKISQQECLCKFV